MANLVGYMANVAKSIGYSVQDNVKDYMPNTTEFVETNAEVFKSVYHDIRNFRLTLKRTSTAIKNNKIYEAADLGYHAIIEDLKNGTFYNKQRIDRVDIQAMGSLGVMEDDEETSKILNSLESGDTSFDDNIDDFFKDDEDDIDLDSLDPGSKKLAKSTIISGELVSDTVVKTGKYIADNSRITANLMYTQNVRTHNMIQNNMDQINNNLASVVELGNMMTASLENTTKFYNDSIQQLQDQTALLRTISENLIGISEKVSDNNDEDMSYGKIVNSKGIPNLKKYKQMIKQNFKNKFSDVNSMGGMMGEDSNIFLSLAASPLSYPLNAFTKQMIPTQISRSMKKIDKSFSSFFGALMGKLNYISANAEDEEKGFITKTLSDLFGIKSDEKNSLNTAGYNKGKVAWNGKSDRTLNEVIPTYLRKILSAITGKEEKLYDHERGSFVSGSSVEKDFESYKKSAIERSTSDVRKEFSEFLDTGVKYKNDRERKSVQDDLKRFFEKLYEDEYIDLNNKDKYSDYGINARNYQMFVQMYKKLNNSTQMNTLSKILKEKSNLYNSMQNMEQNPDAIARNLFNNSDLNEFVEFKKDKYGNKVVDETSGKSGVNWLKNSTDDKGNNVFYYLENLYREVYAIRNNIGYGGYSTPSNMSSFDVLYNRTEIKPSDLKVNDSLRNLDRDFLSNEEFEKEQKTNLEHYKSLYSGPIADLSKINDRNKKSIDQVEEEFSYAFESFQEDRNNTNKFKKNIKESERNMIDKLLAKKDIFGKMTVMNNYFNKLATRPVKAFENMVGKIDQRLYEIIFGKPDDDGNNSFMGKLTKELKNSFNKFNKWLDDKVLKSIKEKLNIKSMKELPGKIFEGLFGKKYTDVKQDIRNFFFDENEGLFPKIRTSVKDVFSGAWDSVKSAFSGVGESISQVFSPLTDKIKAKKDKEAQAIRESEALFKINKRRETQTETAKKDKEEANNNERLIENIINQRYNDQREEEKLHREVFQTVTDPITGERKLVNTYYLSRKHKIPMFKKMERLFNLKLNNGSIVPDTVNGITDVELLSSISDIGFDKYNNLNLNESILANTNLKQMRDKASDKSKTLRIVKDYIADLKKINTNNMLPGERNKYFSIERFLNQNASKLGLSDEDIKSLKEYADSKKLFIQDDIETVAKSDYFKDQEKYLNLSNHITDILRRNKSTNPTLYDIIIGNRNNSSNQSDTNIGEERNKRQQELEEVLTGKKTFGLFGSSDSNSPVVKLLSSINKGLYYIIPMIQEKTGFGKGKRTLENGKIEYVNTKAQNLFEKYKSPVITDPNSPEYNEKDAKMTLIDNIMSNIWKSISDPITSLQEFSSGGTEGETPITKLSKGAKEYVDKKTGNVKGTGIISISKGESITNVKTTQNINDAINEIITKNTEYRSMFKEIYALLSGKEDTTQDQLNEMLSNKAILKELSTAVNTGNGRRLSGKLIDEGYISKEQFQNATVDYKGRNTIQESASEILETAGKQTRTFLDKTYEILFNDKLNDKQLSEASKDISKNIKNYLPTMVGGGLLGSGVSLLTGLVGGPILGAAAGASVALVKKSEKLQNFLFGEKIDDKYQGGLFDKEIVNSVAKVFPDVKNFGIVGGLTGLLPFLPFGPVGGMFLGAATGFLKNTDTVKENLFGQAAGLKENEFLKKATKTLKKAAPVSVATLLPSLMVGPFGFLGNALMAGGLGLMSTSDKFEQFVMGKKSKTTGQYENGLLPSVRDHLVNPIKKFMTEAKTTVKDWFKENITNPLKDAVHPMFNQLKIAGKSIVGLIGRSIDSVFEKSIGVPMGKWVEDKIIKRATNLASKLFKFLLAPAKFIVSAPFKTLGAVGRSLNRRQVKKGNSTDSAEDRLKVWNTMSAVTKMKNKNQYDIDKEMADSSDAEIYLMQQQLQELNGGAKGYESKSKEVLEDTGNEVSAYFDKYSKSLLGKIPGVKGRAGAKDVMKLFKEGKIDEVQKALEEEKSFKDTAIKNMSNDILKYGKKLVKGKDPKLNALLKSIKDSLTPEQYKEMINALQNKDTDTINRIIATVKKESDDQFKTINQVINDNGKKYNSYKDIDTSIEQSKARLFEKLKNGNYSEQYKNIVTGKLENTGRVAQSYNIKLYSIPSSNPSKVITSLEKGDNVEIIKEEGDYLYVKTKYGNGYVKKEDIVRDGNLKVNTRALNKLTSLYNREVSSRNINVEDLTKGIVDESKNPELDKNQKFIDSVNNKTINEINKTNNFLDTIQDTVNTIKNIMMKNGSGLYESMKQEERDRFDTDALISANVSSKRSIKANKNINENFDKISKMFNIKMDKFVLTEEEMDQDKYNKIYNKKTGELFFTDEDKKSMTKGIRVPYEDGKFIYKFVKLTGGTRDQRYEQMDSITYVYLAGINYKGQRNKSVFDKLNQENNKSKYYPVQALIAGEGYKNIIDKYGLSSYENKEGIKNNNPNVFTEYDNFELDPIYNSRLSTMELAKLKINKLRSKIGIEDSESKGDSYIDDSHIRRFADDGTPLVYKLTGKNDIEPDLSDSQTKEYFYNKQKSDKEIETIKRSSDKKSLFDNITDFTSGTVKKIKGSFVGKILGGLFKGAKNVLKVGGIAVAGLSALGAAGYASDYISDIWKNKFKPWLQEKAVPLFKSIVPTIGGYIMKGIDGLVNVAYNSADAIVSKGVDIILKVGPKLIWALCKKGLSYLPIIGDYFTDSKEEQKENTKQSAISEVEADMNNTNNNSSNNTSILSSVKTKISTASNNTDSMTNYYTDYQNSTGMEDYNSNSTYFDNIPNSEVTDENSSNIINKYANQYSNTTSNTGYNNNTDTTQSSGNAKAKKTTYITDDGTFTINNKSGILYNKQNKTIYNDYMGVKNIPLEQSSSEKIRDTSSNAFVKSMIAGLLGYTSPGAAINKKLKWFYGGKHAIPKTVASMGGKVASTSSTIGNNIGKEFRNAFVKDLPENVIDLNEFAARKAAQDAVIERALKKEQENAVKKAANTVAKNNTIKTGTGALTNAQITEKNKRLSEYLLNYTQTGDSKAYEKALKNETNIEKKLIKENTKKAAKETAAKKAAEKQAAKQSTNVLESVAQKASTETVDNTNSKVASLAEQRLKRNASKTGTSVVDNALENEINKTATKVGSEVAEEATEKPGLVKKLASKIVEMLSKAISAIASTDFVQGILGKEKAQKVIAVLKSAPSKISGFLTKNLNKVANTTLGKGVTAVIGHIPELISKLVIMTGYFLAGYNDASEYFDILRPTLGEKFISGLMNMLLNLPLPYVWVLGLIPTKLWIGWFGEQLLPIFGTSIKELENQKESAAEGVNTYNEKYGTEYTAGEYYDNVINRNNTSIGSDEKERVESEKNSESKKTVITTIMAAIKKKLQTIFDNPSVQGILKNAIDSDKLNSCMYTYLESLEKNLWNYKEETRISVSLGHVNDFTTDELIKVFITAYSEAGDKITDGAFGCCPSLGGILRATGGLNDVNNTSNSDESLRQTRINIYVSACICLIVFKLLGPNCEFYDMESLREFILKGCKNSSSISRSSSQTSSTKVNANYNKLMEGGANELISAANKLQGKVTLRTSGKNGAELTAGILTDGADYVSQYQKENGYNSNTSQKYGLDRIMEDVKQQQQVNTTDNSGYTPSDSEMHSYDRYITDAKIKELAKITTQSELIKELNKIVGITSISDSTKEKESRKSEINNAILKYKNWLKTHISVGGVDTNVELYNSYHKDKVDIKKIQKKLKKTNDNLGRGGAITADNIFFDDITEYPKNFNITELNNWLSNKLKSYGSNNLFNRFGITGTDLYNAANDNNIDPRFLGALCQAESNFGNDLTSQSLNNPVGYGIFENGTSPLAHLPADKSALSIVASKIKKDFFDLGYHSLYSLSKNKDGHAYNYYDHWSNLLSNIMFNETMPSFSNEEYTEDPWVTKYDINKSKAVTAIRDGAKNSSNGNYLHSDIITNSGRMPESTLMNSDEIKWGSKGTAVGSSSNTSENASGSSTESGVSGLISGLSNIMSGVVGNVYGELSQTGEKLSGGITDFINRSFGLQNFSYDSKTATTGTENNNSASNDEEVIDGTGGVDRVTKSTLNTNKPADNWFKRTLGSIKSSDYGWRENPNPKSKDYGKPTWHEGIDFATGSNSGQKVTSPIDGVVSYVHQANAKENKDKVGYGNAVGIKDSNGKIHLFGHMLNKTNFKNGDRIKQGDTIGRVGSTGASTGNHLHYGIYDKSMSTGSDIDPNKYLATLNSKGGEDLSKIKYFKNVDSKKTLKESKEYEKNLGKGGSTTNIQKVKLDNTTMILLKSIINILSKEVENTNVLKEIKEILSNKLGINVKTNKPDNLKSKSSKIIKSIQKTISNTNDNTNVDTDLNMVELLNLLASE